MLKANIKNIFETAARIIFQVMLFLFIIFTVLEIIKPEIVLSYINIEWLTLIMMISGALVILFLPLLDKAPRKLKFFGNLLIALLSVLFGIFILYWLRGIGGASIVIGLVSAIIFYILIVYDK